MCGASWKIMSIQYKRILLKLSGESLMGNSHELYEKETINQIATQISEIYNLGAEVAITIGGGNIFRGINADNFGLDRTNADYMGMLATIMNGIALKDFLAHHGLKAKLYSALAVGNIVDGYNREKVLESLKDKFIVIFVGGTGNPFFSTDSGAALRALEIKADLIIKATKVDGVYDKDPVKHKDAKKYLRVSFNEAIAKDLKVMDLTAFDLCKNNKINIDVCNIFHKNALKDSIIGKTQGTIIHA